jgi:hypothetical protein
MAGGYDPLAGKVTAGQYRLPPLGSPQNPADADPEEASPLEALPAGQQTRDKFVLPPREELGPMAEEDRHAKLAEYDDKVAKAWDAHKQNAGLHDYSLFPPGYRPATYAGGPAPDQEGSGILNPTPEPDPIKGANPAPPPAARETQQQGYEQAGPPPQARPSGGGGGPPGVDYGKRLNDDYNERIRAMEAERDARGAGASDVAGAFGRAEDEQRGGAEASMAQSHAAGEQMRAKIAEVQQLNEDYAKGQLDPNPLWGNESVPHAIGAVLGTMLAGIGGGVKGAQEYFNNLVDKNLMVQKDQMDRQYKSTLGQQNLLGSLMRTSDSEQEAMDKARAVLYGAAMTEVQKSAAAAKGPVETAQIDQLIADMKATRDAMLAKLQGQQQAAAAGPGANGMLEVSGEDIIQHGGQSYLITDKSWGDTLRNTLSAYDRLGEALNAGEQSLKGRSALDALNPWSGNIASGESAQAAASESVAKLAGSRGVPPNIAHMVSQLLPTFGSRTTFDTPDNIAKVRQVRQMLGQWAQDTMGAAGATPVSVVAGPGRGKNAGKLTYYAGPPQPGQAPQQRQPAGPPPLRTFQPSGG